MNSPGPDMRKKDTAGKHSFGILAFCLLVSIGISAVYYTAMQRQSLKDIERIRTLYAERTENFINSVFHKTDVLAAVVKLENGNITESTFDEIARIVYTENSGIRGIQYMPGAVVTYSYPLAGNEAVMGKNFLEIPERREDCLLAINTKSIALSGPYNLIQGGLGLVARNPVFLENDAGEETFWGFSTIVLDLPDALASVGLGSLPESGYDFQLFSINENGERIVIEGNESLDTSGAVSGAIQVPNHAWTLAIVPLHPWMNLLLAGLVFAAGILVSVTLWRLYCTMQRERKAVEAKNAFFSDISHDMRTPLNAIIGFSSLAQIPGTDAEEKDVYLKKIKASGRMMLDLVNDTLTISKAESGKLRENPEPVNTESLFESVLVPVSEIASAKHITFRIDRSGYRPRTILADSLNFQKIFLNLLNNAVKFTPEGGHVSFAVKDIPSGQGDPDLLFTVEDDGIGMSPEFMTRMYEPFVQEQRQGFEGTGTGLGLPIVKRIVSLMGGSIRAQSSEGKGTVFTVQLHFPETAEPEAVREETAADDSVLAGKKILLCEDNETNRQIADALLRNRGMKVVNAVNGQVGTEQFEKSERNEFSLILMDLRMPVMDGFGAARAIRKMKRPDAKSIPIIAMTADVFEEDIRKCREAGMNDHIAKPVEPEILYRTLIRNLIS